MADAEVVVGIKGDSSDFKREVSGLGETTGKALASVAKIGAAAIGTAFVAAGVAVGAFAKKGIELASDLNEVQNVVDTTFGGMSKSIDGWAKTTGAKYGVSELAAKQYSSTVGAMMKSAGIGGDGLKNMSQGIASLSGDMASFYNLDPAEAFEKLRSGISGESEPLKQLGIDVSDTALQTYALTQGISKSTSEMSQSEKMTLRYGLIMQQTADAQGDFAKTSDGYANQQRILGMNIDTLAASFGSMLLPALNTVVTFLNTNIVPAIQGFLDLVKDGTDPVTAFAQMMETSFGIDVTPITNAITFLMDGFKQIGDPAALSGFDSVMYNIGSTIGSIIDAIPFLIDGISGIGDPAALGGVDSVMYDIGTAIGTVLDTAKGVVEWVDTNKDWLAPLAVGVVAMVAAYKAWTTVVHLANVATVAYAAVQWTLNAALSANPIGIVVLAIVGLIAAIVYLWKTNEGFRQFFIEVWAAYKAAAESAWSAVLGFFSDIGAGFSDLVGWFKDLPGKITGAVGNVGNLLKDAGKSIISGFLDGLKGAFDDVKTWVSGIATWIADHKGPLSYDAKLLIPAGKAITEGLGKGLSVGFEDVRALVAGMGEDISTTMKLGVDTSSLPSVGLVHAGAGYGAGAVSNSSTVVNQYITSPVASYSDIKRGALDASRAAARG